MPKIKKSNATSNTYQKNINIILIWEIIDRKIAQTTQKMGGLYDHRLLYQ